MPTLFCSTMLRRQQSGIIRNSPFFLALHGSIVSSDTFIDVTHIMRISFLRPFELVRNTTAMVCVSFNVGTGVSATLVQQW